MKYTIGNRIIPLMRMNIDSSTPLNLFYISSILSNFFPQILQLNISTNSGKQITFIKNSIITVPKPHG